jgi:hypothetical protein
MKSFKAGRAPPYSTLNLELFKTKIVTLKFIKLHEFFQEQALDGSKGCAYFAD